MKQLRSALEAMDEVVTDETLPSQQTKRYQGAIRRLKDGYGFIAGDDGQDYFFHWTAMEKTGPAFKDVVMLDRVEFNLVVGPKGPRAICLRVLR